MRVTDLHVFELAFLFDVFVCACKRARMRAELVYRNGLEGCAPIILKPYTNL
jgi:hypothetical protein